MTGRGYYTATHTALYIYPLHGQALSKLLFASVVLDIQGFVAMCYQQHTLRQCIEGCTEMYSNAAGQFHTQQ